jgi:hypothetical protein
MNVLVAGDIHAEFSRLNDLINKKKNYTDLIICCGDFGYWPDERFVEQFSNIRNHGIKILWCNGNHENHWALKARTSDELAPNVFYMPRGSTYTLEDGRTILFMGGAFSIDWKSRMVGRDWFPVEEIITQKDMMNLPDTKIDIIISHTCPVELYPIMVKYYTGKEIEPSNYALTELWKKYEPSLWFFGHWHHYKEGDLGKTKWYALSYPGSESRWWMWLPKTPKDKNENKR